MYVERDGGFSVNTLYIEDIINCVNRVEENLLLRINNQLFFWNRLYSPTILSMYDEGEMINDAHVMSSLSYSLLSYFMNIDTEEDHSIETLYNMCGEDSIVYSHFKHFVTYLIQMKNTVTEDDE
jgi:hypothetical protein